MIKPILSAMISVESTVLSDAEKRLLNQYNPLGVTLFSRNIENPNQIKKLINEIKSACERDDILIAVDQEGGRVARFKPPFFKDYMAQRSIGSLNNEDDRTRAAYLQALLISDELNELGVNLNYAPCVDVLYKNTGNVLKSRCFSTDEKEVALLAKIMVDVYKKRGIIPCLKHIPGHGRTTVDPHLELPFLDYSMESLNKDFYPFKTLADETPMMMTAHIVLKKMDDKPVTQSKKVIDTIIRGEIGFDGFLISDAIDMKALKGTLTQKTKQSLKAGCDAVCYCMGDVDGAEEVLKASVPLNEKSYERFLDLKKVIQNKAEKESLSSNLINEYQTIKEKSPIFIEDYDAVEILHKLRKK